MYTDKTWTPKTHIWNKIKKSVKLHTNKEKGKAQQDWRDEKKK